MASVIRLTAFLFLSLAVAGNTLADTFGEPRFRGNGCPTDSVSFLATEDAFTVLYDNFSVSTDRGERPFRWCQMRISITIPEGFSVTVDSVDHRGFVQLEPKARAFLYSHYRLGFREFGHSKLTRLKGPLENDFLRRDTAYLRSRRPNCGGETVTLVIDISAWVIGHSRARGFLQMDSTDGAMQIVLNKERCK